jgi:hypothetical protein
MRNETVARPLRCTARSHRTGVPTGLRRSEFERCDGPVQSSSHVTSVLPAIGGDMLAQTSSSSGRSSTPLSHPVSPVPSSLPLLPSRLLLVEVPRHPRADGGHRENRIKKASVPAAAMQTFRVFSSAFSPMVPGYVCDSQPTAVPSFNRSRVRRTPAIFVQASALTRARTL